VHHSKNNNSNNNQTTSALRKNNNKSLETEEIRLANDGGHSPMIYQGLVDHAEIRNGYSAIVRRNNNNVNNQHFPNMQKLNSMQ